MDDERQPVPWACQGEQCEVCGRPTELACDGCAVPLCESCAQPAPGARFLCPECAGNGASA